MHWISIEAVERIGVVALTVILFDGGMHVGVRRSRHAAVPTVSLGILGIFAIAALVALASHYLFDFGSLTSSLLGAALARTDPVPRFWPPFRFHDWDTTFSTRLAQSGKHVDLVTDDDLDAVASRVQLARAYDLIVFPGHEEYATRHMLVVQRYRDLGGNLAFFAANNFFREVGRLGETLAKTSLWRGLGRPEAALVGVQHVGSNHGETQAPFVVAPGHRPGSSAGRGSSLARPSHTTGIEINARAPTSPARDTATGLDPAPARPSRYGGDDRVRDACRRRGRRRGSAELRGLGGDAASFTDAREHLGQT